MLRSICLLLLPLWLPAFVWADGGVSSLRENFDPGLQRSLDRAVDQLGLRPAAKRRKLAIALVDLTDRQEPLVASINGDHMMYAASLPKIAILLGAFVEAESGNLTLNERNRRSLVDMIRYSSNKEATRMLAKVGRSDLIDILTSPRFALYDPAVGGGLWVGKDYGKSPAFRRDPLHNLSHGATAMQTARFYYLLETGQLVHRRASEQMKRILSKPGISHKFVKGLAKFGDSRSIRIYRKSGTWRHWHADSALVEAKGHTYILVALAEDPKGSGWLEDLAQAAHRIVVPEQVASMSK